jgi:tetratricopeptide (TPR) repeat protein
MRGVEGWKAAGGSSRPRLLRRRPLSGLRGIVLSILGLFALSAGGSEQPLPGDEGASSRRAEIYYHLLRAGLALGQGRTIETAAEVERAVALDPASPALRAEASGLLLLAGRSVEAERQARRALELDPSEPVALRVLGDIAAARALGPRSDAASREEAIRLYDRWLAAGGVDDQVLWILARLKLLAGDRTGALEAARRLSSRRPGDPSATRLFVELLVRSGELDQALAEVARALASEPESEDLLPLAAELARRTGAWEPVETACRKRLEADDRDAAARSLLGEALFRLGRAREAVPELEIAIAAGPTDPYARLHLAMAYAASGRFADGLALARGLVVEYPDNPTPRIVVAEVLARQGDLDGAIGSWAEALRASEGADGEGQAQRDEIRRRIASLELGRSRPAEALRWLDELERPDEIASLELRARVAAAMANFSEARSAARRIRDRGELARALLLEAELLARENRLGKARDRFEEAVRVAGASAWGEVTEVWRKLGRNDEAERALRRWVESEPGNPGARFRLGSFLERSGRFSEGEKELRESLRIEPNDPDVLNYLGYSLADRNERLGEALELILKAVELDPWNGAFLDSLGWVYYRLGRYAEAREPLERAARELPRDPTVLEHLGDLYHRLGDGARAADLWKRALEFGADEPDRLRRKLLGGEAASSSPASAPTP